MSPGWWDEAAHNGIVGLEPLDAADEELHGMIWPHGGYDQSLRGFVPRPRADWVALADEMIARWTEWRGRVLAAPAEAFTEEPT